MLSEEMSTREQVAREAARLLYNRTVKEYKDAKEMASSSLGTKALPSNYEVAVELDKLVEEREGSERLNMLIDMRRIALEVMKKLQDIDPVLIGSVWRGTPRRGSDIDIVVYNGNPDEVKHKLREYQITDIEKKEFTLGGSPRTSTHIELQIKTHTVEVVVRPPGDRGFYRDERCETYGDIKRGLRLPELEKLIQTDSLRRFIPKRRVR
jgi:predicted nucleotidyltransferase